MFKLYFTNIPDRGLVGEYATLDSAKVAAKRYGFEATVMMGGDVVAAWSPIGGWKSLAAKCDAERFGDSCPVCAPAV